MSDAERAALDEIAAALGTERDAPSVTDAPPADPPADSPPKT